MLGDLAHILVPGGPGAGWDESRWDGDGIRGAEPR